MIKVSFESLSFLATYWIEKLSFGKRTINMFCLSFILLSLFLLHSFKNNSFYCVLLPNCFSRFLIYLEFVQSFKLVGISLLIRNTTIDFYDCWIRQHYYNDFSGVCETGKHFHYMKTKKMSFRKAWLTFSLLLKFSRHSRCM